MRIAIMGTGGMGGYFGFLLARAGHDVAFIARGAHLEAMRANGLTLKSVLLGDMTLPVHATNDPGSIGPVDLVMICVKTYDLDTAAQQSLPLVGPGTVVMPIQNGADAGERTGAVVGPEHLVRGISYVAASITAPGVVSHTAHNRLLFGEPGGGTSERVESLLQAFSEAGIGAEVPPDIRVAEWQKYVMVCGGFGALGVTRLPFGPVLACPESRWLLHEMVREAVRVGRASGVGLAEDYADVVMSMFATTPPTLRSSMLNDLLAGRRLELESVNGKMVRLGAELGVPTPLNQAAYAALKPYVDGPPQMPGQGD